jgi:hypothetical protein
MGVNKNQDQKVNFVFVNDVGEAKMLAKPTFVFVNISIFGS